MPKRTLKKPIEKKQRQKATQNKTRTSLTALVLSAATLIGVPAAVVTFLPRVTATVSDPVDPNNPFSASVTITNTGFLPLDSVQPFFGLQKITLGDPKKPTTFNGFSESKTLIASSAWHPSDLGLDDKVTFGLNEIWGKQPTLLTADIAIVIQYQLPIIHWKREKVFPLTAVKQTNGIFYWYSSAPGMDEHPGNAIPPVPSTPSQ